MYEEYGRDAAINDGGRFTEQGYIYNNRNTFTEWYDGRDVPEEYRVTPQPPVQEKEQADLDASAAIPTTATEQPPVLPIILSSEKPADKMKEITDRLEQGILGLYESDRYADYLRTMSKFHDYSLNNTILIAMQGGNLVKGYKQWEKEFDRHVKPGEKAIKILAPSPFTVKKQVEKIDPDTQKPVFDRDGKPDTEEKEIPLPAFRVVSVVGISQTEGKELPALTYELTGNVEQYKDFFAALEKTSPFAMGFEALSGGVKGRCNYEEKRIIINEGMDELQNIKTAIHEIAHATLHDTALAMPERPDRRTREVQAESVAYAVCQHYGLDTSDYSFGYIAGWSSGKELAELKGSLETIRSTAASLIDTIDGHFAEIQKAQDKEQTTEQAQTPQEATIQPEAEAAAPELPEETAPVQEKEAQTEPEADTGASSEAPQPEQAAPAAPYYTINEAAAKRAKDANSFSDYKQGSATAEYRHYVDEAVQIAERQKQRVDPMYHEKIDSLLDTYARILAANMNKGYEIDARVPSILIAGGSNFPTRKKEKQNAARDSNYREWQDIQGLLDKIRSTGMGGISADDPQAVQKLEKKLESLEKSQETMKAVNAYYRKHKTLDGCPHLPPEELEKLKADMASSWHLEDKPFATWALSNNRAEIRRVKDRIKSLSQQKEIGFVGWKFDGGKVEANTEANRLQIFFEDKPDEATREALKSNGFRWSPKAGAWQRQLTSNAYYAADYVKAIVPLTGEKPTELQRAHIRAQKVDAQEQPEQEAPQDKDTFSIYQIKGGDETRDFRFEPYDRLTATGHRVDAKNYSLVYSAELQAAGNSIDRGNYELIFTAPLTPGMSLEDIYTRFNIDHPKDFKGHSLSVSDVVVLHQNGQDTAHYVDSFGYKKVPEFLQPENYLKTAEPPTEQNYNMIDGQINPTPTAAELEEKAKAGGQISLAEYAEALKTDKERGKPAKQETPSIRAQLKAAKEQTPKKQARQKTQDLERS